MCNDVVVPQCKAAPNRVTMRTPVDSFAGSAGLAVSVVGVVRIQASDALIRCRRFEKHSRRRPGQSRRPRER